MDMQAFHFIRPYWLLVLLPLAVLIYMMIRRKLGNRSWEMVCDEALLPHILIGGASKSRRLSVLLTAVGGIIAIIALAGPAWEKLPQPVFTADNALVLALDMSRSMDANDISPSRLVRARYKIADILETREEGQTALLVYAGDAFTVTPLTDDTATIQSQLAALETDIMPVQGNRTDMAIQLGMELLKQAGLSKGDILLITDEVDLLRSESLLPELRQQAYRLSVLGVGTEHGTPISLPDGSFLKDRSGEIVIPVLDEDSMRRLSDDGGGRYLRMTLNDTDVEALDGFFSGANLDSGLELAELEADVWKEQGPWLLLLLLPLTAVIFRRGFLAVLVIFMVQLPENAQALDWESLWLNDAQRGKRALDSGDHQQAVELFDDPGWRGSAQYRAGDFNGALETLGRSDALESVYNAGNSLARMGKYQEAIKLYESVLDRAPDHEDALYNKELLEEELKKQQQQQQQQDSDNQDDPNNQEGQDQQQSAENQDQQQEAANQDQQQASDESEQQQNSEQQAGDDSQQEDQNGQRGNQRTESEQEAQENAQSQAQQLAEADSQPPDEEQQATEQWLRRIPDDPAGLLRRKFLYQYQQRRQQAPPDEKDW